MGGVAGYPVDRGANEVVMFKVLHQPIAALGGNEYFPEAWAWGVFDGMVCIARFGSRQLAEDYCDWRIAHSRGLVPTMEEHRRVADALAQALFEKQAAEAALQAFIEGRFTLERRDVS
jgi:hypothetical protein